MTTIVAYTPTGIIDKALFNFDAMGGGLVDFRLSGTVNVSISQPFMYSQYLSGYGNNLAWSPDVSSVVWNATQVANINSILAMYSSFVNLSFSTVVNDTAYSPAGVGLLTNSDINISLIYRTDLNWSGMSSIIQNNFGYTGSPLDIILNEYGFGSADYSLNNSTYGFHTLMHEIGHSIGLSHPHSAYTNGVATLTADYSATVNLGFQKLGFVINSAKDMNKEYFSIMSYDDTKPPSGTDTFAQTPMILDAIALIDAYGAGTGTSGAGNDTITPGASIGVGAYRTYFDLGGTNTVNLVNYSSGAYFNMGTTITGASHLVGVSMSIDDYKKMISAGSPSSLRWYYGEFQNALGSSGNDYIVGNDLNNLIDAISGIDKVDGGGGNNTLVLDCSINDCIKAGALNNSGYEVIYTKLGIDTITNIQTITFTDATYSVSSLLSLYTPLVSINSNGGLTKNLSLVITGSAIANANISLFDGVNLLGTGIADASGNWSVNINLSTQGAHILSATSVDIANNSSTSQSITYTLDSIAPYVAITSVGGIFTQSSQTINGVGELGTIVSIYDNGTLIGSTTVGANGSWSTTINWDLVIPHTITATDTDTAGNVGYSNAVNFLTPAPVITAMANHTSFIPTGWQKIDPAILGDGGLQVTTSLPITQYRITDSGGHLQFYANGSLVTGSSFTFANPYLNGGPSTDVYVRGLSAGVDTLTISAYDGTYWSTPVSFTDIVKAADVPFTVAATGIKATTEVNSAGGTPLSSLVSFTGSNSGNGVTQLQFYISGAGGDGGCFTWANSPDSRSFPTGTVFWLNNAPSISTLKYVASSTPGAAETLYVNAFDGYAWSGWYHWNQVSGSSANSAPVITHMDNRTAYIPDDWTQVDAFFLTNGSFTVTDANSDAITQYRVIDTTSSSAHVQFYKSGIGTLNAGQSIEFTASDLASGKLFYKGLSAGTDTFTIQAYDGQDWSAAYSFSMAVRATDTPFSVTSTNTSPSASTSFSNLASFSNPAHDAVQDIKVYIDALNSDGGYLSYIDSRGANHNITAGKMIELETPALIASLKYTAGNNMVGSSEALHINAFDGYSWSSWTVLTEQANSSSPMMLGLSSDGLSGVLENNTDNLHVQVSGNGIPILANYLESSGQKIHLDTRLIAGVPTLAALSAANDANGNLLDAYFSSGPTAQANLGGNIHLAYDTNTGGLFYQDNSGHTIEIAIIGQPGHFTQLHAADFHVG